MPTHPLAAMHRVARLVVALAWLPLCSGCIVGPDFCRPNTPVPDTWHQQLEQGEYVGSAELDRWWTQFDDPILDQLIECADDGNLDLYAALTRIRQARAQVCIARSARLAFVQETGSFQNSLQSLNAIGFGGGIPGFLLGARDFWTTAFDLSWEPDLFGRVQRQIDSACATTQATVEAYRDVLVLLYADVASNYVSVRTTQAQLEFALNNVALQKRALDLATKRVEAGVSAILDQHQAESNLAATEAQIPQLETQLHQDLNRLAVLLGQYPGSLHECLAKPQRIPVPTTFPETVPCDLVRQRPDVRQAERQLAARCADLGVAAADLFPRFMINGSFGLQSQKLSNLFTSDSWTYNVGPSFSWPIFQGFRVMCNIDAADAAVEEAIAIYEQTILRAVEEVENAVIGFNNERERFEATERTVEAAEKTLKSVVATYGEGKTDFLNVVDTLRTLTLAQNALAVSEGQIVQELITLYKALGGGWDPHHHCRQRRPRVQCPDRADPSIVDQTVVEDPSQRFFGEGTDGDEEDGKEDEDQAAQREAPDTIYDGAADEAEPLESLLQRKVEELEQRLREPPEDAPPPSPADPAPEPRSPDSFDELLQPGDAQRAPREFWR